MTAMDQTDKSQSKKMTARERLEARGSVYACMQCAASFLSVPRPGRPGGRTRFCGPACASRHRSDNATSKSHLKRKCKQCGIEKEAGLFPLRRLVCTACVRLTVIARQAKSGEEKECEKCGVLFSSLNTYRGFRRFCSRECANSAMETKTNKPCLNCGSLVRRKKELERVYCSEACRNKHSIGPNNPTWKGGVIKETGVLTVHVGPRAGYASKSWAVHRCVASNEIGRQLTKAEYVIHLDNNKQNNKPDNLFVCESHSEYMRRLRGVTMSWPTESNLTQLRNACCRHDPSRR